MNFYQSDLRRYINQHIYKKPLFEIEILGQQYFGIMKMQRRMGKELRWYMVHGVEGMYASQKQGDVEEALKRIKRDFHSSRGDIFFQLGCVDMIDKQSTKELKEKKAIKETTDVRLKAQQHILKWYDMQPSWREHMPNATIVLDLTKNATALKSDFSSSGKRFLNKAKKVDLEVAIADKKDWKPFRRMRYKTSYDKGFAIIGEESFMALMSYLIETKQGNLFLAKKGKDIVSGSIILTYEKDLIYLYGATDRSFGAIGGHYLLMYEIMKWGHAHHKTSLDLLGIAPTGFESGHSLAGVTRFKQALGGNTISYLGNFDLVFSPWLYTTFKAVKKG